MTALEIIKKKIYSASGHSGPDGGFWHLETIQKQIAVWRLKDYKIVFTNGCFDILHQGHIDYLSKAADMGDTLIIGINSDSSVKKLGKGNNRPIQSENDRAIILSSLSFVDAVIIFEQETPYELIKMIQPDVLVKGGDWKEEEIIGADIVKSNGGLVTTIPFVEGYSTTNIERKIKSDII